jgi:glycogen operon protein
MHLWPGLPYPLGASYDGTGMNVAVYSGVADAVELCVFDDDGTESRYELPERHGPVWHGYLPLAEPGLRYGFRVHGRWDPRRGANCNPAKLLLDPYAKAIEGGITPHESLRLANDDLSMNTVDNAPHVPRSVLVNPYFDWTGDTPLNTPLSESVVYEAHVKGLTKRLPGVEERWRGTYVGLMADPLIEHLQRIGVTAVELLPVHQIAHDGFLQERGLTNYWGYNTIGYFAPHNEYAATGQRGQQVQEFKRMVRTLHQAGIEVILDVVFNHSGEGGFHGPAVVFRGYDGAYYHADPNDRTRYIDFTGCGNSLDMTNPYVLQLVMDSLRYWVQEMRVDGFRFDLAVTLARETGMGPEKLSSFFDLVQQDPVVSRVKLIAEPWDIGWAGYQVGNFPTQWAEWNGKFRDCVRDYWRGNEGVLPELATRLAGSSDLYADDGRTPFASVNFVTAHDGFTMADLVAYDRKHNEANLEGNRDGSDDNRSWNSGIEGPTDDPDIIDLRARRHRALLATLLLAQGVPMLLAGDEMGNSQGGNNNAYCQDSEISWLDWEEGDQRLVDFTAALVALSRDHCVLQRRRFFGGQPANGSHLPDLVYLAPAGHPMTDGDWRTPWNRALGMFLNGEAITERDRRGQPRTSDSFLLCLNSWHEPVTFTVPDATYGAAWQVAVDTAEWAVPPPGRGPVLPGSALTVEGHTVVVLQRPSTTAD